MCENLHVDRMSKRGRDGAVKQPKAKRRATAEAKYLAGVDRAVQRYGAAAVAKYYVPAGELKGLDTDVSIPSGSLLNTTNTNGNTFVANLIQAGTGSWNRVGRKTHLKSLRLKGVMVQSAQPAATTGNMLELRSNVGRLGQAAFGCCYPVV